MPATPSRIAFITQAQRIVTAGPDSGVQTKYGYAARDTEQPINSFFDSTADAQAIATERLNLLKADRRRIEFGITGEDTAMGLNYKGLTPVATVIDDQRGLNKPAAIVQFGINFDKGQSILVAWG